MAKKNESGDTSFDSRELYDIYRVKIALRDRLFGGMPKNPDLIEAWVKARTGCDDEITKEQVQAAKDEVVDAVAEKTWIGFSEDKEKGLYIHARNVKAMFKEVASVLRITVDKRGSKQILQHGFEVKPCDAKGDRIYLDRAKPDGTEERPIHVQTAQGPRTALKRADYVEGVVLDFDVWVLKTAPAETRHVGEADLRRMLKLAQEDGLGADRSQGSGKFDVVEFYKVS